MPATLALLLLLGCGASQTSESTSTETPTDTPSEADERNPRYTTRGTVEEIREERRQIVIHHEDVPGYMPEMTMPFQVEDLSLLEGLAVGARVEFTFSAEPGGRHVVRAIRRL